MKIKAVDLHVKGLKCDRQGCGYEQQEPDSQKFEDWAKWLHVPCPRCGDSLLSQADLDTVKLLLSGTNVLNELLGPLMPENVDPDERVIFELSMDGSGSINPKRKEAE